MGVWPSRLDHDTLVYWRGLEKRTLTLGRCEDCRHWIHPPRGCCPVCGSDNIGTDSPSGRARLYSYVVQPMVAGGPPVVIGWAELEEQERLFIVGPIEGETAESVRIGAELTLGWQEALNTFVPSFRQGV